jgi:signal transduction histidine kinase
LRFFSSSGEGDLHDPRYDQYKKSVVLTGDGIFSSSSATYTLTLYPSQDFVQVYSTTNPMIATVGAVCIMVFTSLLFFLYDYYVRQEFNAKKHLLEAKRKFVRFVSHEVRTPLNTVCMGLTLMQEEIGGALGYNSTSTSSTQRATTTSTTMPAVAAAADQDEELIKRDDVVEWFNLAHEVLNNAQSAVGVLNDLLNYDKIEMGALALELSIVPIWSMIERTSKEFRFPAGNKKIDFQITLLHHHPAANGDTENPVEDKAWPLDSKRLSSELKELNVVGDKIRITQALRNLVSEKHACEGCVHFALLTPHLLIGWHFQISNALKFTPEGGKKDGEVLVFLSKPYNISSLFLHLPGSLTVEAAYLRPGEDVAERDQARTFALQSGDELKVKQSGYIRVSVTDTGAGMTQDQLSKLFQAGVQFNVNELQAGQGSGLGLYITKGIVEQHRGELKATSPGLGLGTTFSMTLPLYHLPDPNKANTMDDSSCHGEFDRSGAERRNSMDSILPMSILVVDDACMNRKLLCRLLKLHGHTCTEAQDGQEAVDVVKNAKKGGKRYDTILMDYEMPIMNGPAATRAIRALGCDSFIIGITGNVLPEE